MGSHLATNPDWVCPTDQPTILVDCGSICAMLEKTTGRKPDVTLGKPQPDIILQNIGYLGDLFIEAKKH